ncbi:cache domain-containing sensor histidine kinase [Cohnella lupini]|nr:sensor histidine kinase [Cohnella lupini]
MNQISANILDTLDLEINSLYSTALKVVSSSPVKDAFFQNTNEPAELNKDLNNLANIVLTINGPKPNFYKLNLYRNDGYTFAYGNQYFAEFGDLKQLLSEDWVKATLQQEGKKYISPPHIDARDPQATPIISISMSFAEVYGMKSNNIVEIEQKYSVFENIIQKAVISPLKDARPTKSVYVLDRQGKVVFPYGGDDQTTRMIEGFRDLVVQAPGKMGEINLVNPQDHQKSIGVYAQSEFSGWLVLLLEPEASLTKPVRTFNEQIILLGFISLMITLIMTYFVSRSLSRPIKHINKSLKNLELDSLNLKKAVALNSQFDELEELNQTFIEMRDRLKESLEEAVSARSHEIQSRFLALQSQMNPHFLYNSLSVITIMCEENRNEDAIRFCKGLSNILRYTSSTSFKSVSLREEIKHTTDYISLMQERYGSMLEFHLNIPEVMMDLRIPKLIIQPLVENCIKHGIHVEPPWIIRITGKLLSENWMITVSDNGSGMEPEVIQGLNKRFRETDSLKEMPEINLNGMGLVNIYTRLKIFNEDKLIFDLKNNKAGGTSVTVGGLRKYTEE